MKSIMCISHGHRTQQLRTYAVEMHYIWGACSVSGWDGENNQNMYKWFGVQVTAKGVDCGVLEWAQLCTLRWFGYMWCELIFEERVYEERIKKEGIRGRPPVKWVDRVSKYIGARVGNSRIECYESAETGRDGNTSATVAPWR